MLRKDRIQEAYEGMLYEAKGKEAIMGYIEALDKHYGHPPNVDIDLNDIAKGKHGKGIHYKALQSAAKALSKSGKIKFDGFNKITAFVKESKVDEAMGTSLADNNDFETRIKEFIAWAKKASKVKCIIVDNQKEIAVITGKLQLSKDMNSSGYPRSFTVTSSGTKVDSSYWYINSIWPVNKGWTISVDGYHNYIIFG